MSESSRESSRSNKDGNRRVTVAYFSTEAQEEAGTHARAGRGRTLWQERGNIDRSSGQKVRDEKCSASSSRGKTAG